MDHAGDSGGGAGDGRHRNWRQGLGSHSLRHSCARHWLQSGLNVNAVSAWLGHSNPTVTLDTYLVLAPDTLWASARLRNPCCANLGDSRPGASGPVRRAIIGLIARRTPAEIAPLSHPSGVIHDHRRQRPADRPPPAGW